MSKTKNLFKILAIIATVLSGLLATSIQPDFNSYILTQTLSPKYQNLNKAMQTLTTMSYQTFMNLKANASKILEPKQAGFNEFYELLNNKVPNKIDKGTLSGIIVIEMSPLPSMGKYEITPRYSVCVISNKTVDGIALIFSNELGSWIEVEKQRDLQTFSFWSLICAVGFDLIADVDPTRDRIVKFLKTLGVKTRLLLSQIESVFIDVDVK